MSRILFVILSLICAVTVQAQFPNITISEINSPNELCVSISPVNPNEIIAGSNHNNLYFSTDSGKTWEQEFVISKYGVWGDPVTHINQKGEYFFFHLSNPSNGNWIDRIVVQKKKSLYQDWAIDTFTGLNGAKAQDKHWVAEDPTNGNLYLTWTQFDEYGSEAKDKFSNIRFSKSTDGGKTWSKAAIINEVPGDCLDDDNTVEGAVPCVGPKGEIYVSWAGPAGLVFDRSLDGGRSWLENDIFIDSIPGGWSFDVPGIYRCNGMPVTACDRSNSKYKGNIYVNWSDQRNGKNNTDVFLGRSEDGGRTWNAPVKVNNDATQSHQFMSWMTIDQSNGDIYIVFYDRRHHYDNKTDVFLAVSRDGGRTFSNHRISEQYFEPDSSVFFGDYSNIDVKHNMIRPVWTRLHKDKLSAKTALINTGEIKKHDPNSWIAFSPHPTTASIELVTGFGEILDTLKENISLKTGYNAVEIPKFAFEQKTDRLYFELKSNGRLLNRRVIVKSGL